MTTRTDFIQFAVEGALKKAQDEGYTRRSVDPKRVLYLRPSSFHYCPLRTFFGLPKALSKSTQENFSTSFFTKVGTATHLVWQSAMEVSSVRLLKDWQCVNRECKHRVVLEPAPKDMKCPKCGSPVKGDEHEIDLDYLQGHVDEILLFDRGGKTYAVPIDYKSTSAAKIYKKRKEPDEAYVAQISSYATLIKPILAKRGIEVLGWALVFFTRDNPFKTVVVPGKTFMPKEKLKRWAKEHTEVIAKVSQPEHLKPLVRNRMCKTREEMEGSIGRCDHVSRCIHGDRTCFNHAKAILDTLRDKLPVVEFFRREGLLPKDHHANSASSGKRIPTKRTKTR